MSFRMIDRRSVLCGLLAAPIVLKATSLMALRGIVMPVRGFIWGKQVTTEIDPYIGYRGEEMSGVVVPLDKADGALAQFTMEEEARLDTLRSLTLAHGGDAEILVRRMDFPLTFRRLKFGGDHYSVIAEEQAEA